MNAINSYAVLIEQQVIARFLLFIMIIIQNLSQPTRIHLVSFSNLFLCFFPIVIRSAAVWPSSWLEQSSYGLNGRFSSDFAKNER